MGKGGNAKDQHRYGMMKLQRHSRGKAIMERKI